MRISDCPLHPVLLLLLLLLLALEPTWTATILHHHGGGATSAVSHQSFVRLSTQSAQQLILQQQQQQQQLQLALSPGLKDSPHTPAHLAYAAQPVVHQTLPRIKPVRNLSYASFIPGPRSSD
ncbi:hypothetical protein ACLKA7_017521 [Drosophila subpalustris]